MSIDYEGMIEASASLFGDISSDGPMTSVIPPVPNVPEWPRRALLGAERSVLGRYVSDHPLRGKEALLRRSTHTVAQLLDPECDAKRVTLACMVTSLTRMPRKTWAKAMVEDLDGSIEVLFFPATYAKLAGVLAPDIICLITGTRKDDEGAISLMAQSLTVLEK